MALKDIDSLLKGLKYYLYNFLHEWQMQYDIQNIPPRKCFLFVLIAQIEKSHSAFDLQVNLLIKQIYVSLKTILNECN